MDKVANDFIRAVFQGQRGQHDVPPVDAVMRRYHEMSEAMEILEVLEDAYWKLTGVVTTGSEELDEKIDSILADLGEFFA